jgi:hypothetical protein
MYSNFVQHIDAKKYLLKQIYLPMWKPNGNSWVELISQFFHQNKFKNSYNEECINVQLQVFSYMSQVVGATNVGMCQYVVANAIIYCDCWVKAYLANSLLTFWKFHILHQLQFM